MQQRGTDVRRGAGAFGCRMTGEPVEVVALVVGQAKRPGEGAQHLGRRLRAAAYGVLSRGLVSGHWSTERSRAGTDFRSHTPRFLGDNLERNLVLVEALRRVASEAGVTVAQAAIAWVASRGEDIVPLVGARTRERLSEALGAVDLQLSADQLLASEKTA